MIYILAGTYDHARKWAQAQQLASHEWFSTLDVDELKQRVDFHVIVLDTAAELPSPLFEKLFRLGQIRGRIKDGNYNHNRRS